MKNRGAIVGASAACHRVEGIGHEIGPNLATVQNRGADFILLNVLDPNREVNPQYVNYVVETKDGRSFTGMVAAETATSVTLRRAENLSDTILRIDIERMRSTGLSIMPEGLEQQVDRQAMADLIAYILALIRYGFLTVHQVVATDQTPPLSEVGKTLSILLERALAPEGGADHEAGKQVLMQTLEMLREMVRQFREKR